MPPQISIIVPVYNVEKYLRRCLDSVLAQDFTDYDVILIDDGSTDGSAAICDEYLRHDNRIRIKHLTNAGPSNARNVGIQMATGDYLMFADSDDYVEHDWCSVLYQTAIENDCALPISGMRCVYVREAPPKEVIRAFPSFATYARANYLETCNYSLASSLCCKIYKMQTVVENNIRFDPNIKIGEDLLFNLKYLVHMNSFVTVPSITYNYMKQDENSLLNQHCKELNRAVSAVFNAWMALFSSSDTITIRRGEFATYYYMRFIGALRNTFDPRNPESLMQKLRRNQEIVKSQEFIECMHLADTSKEDARYIRVLKTKNYYLVWLFEQTVAFRNYIRRRLR